MSLWFPICYVSALLGLIIFFAWLVGSSFSICAESRRLLDERQKMWDDYKKKWDSK
jgi:hypothetical protein